MKCEHCGLTVAHLGALKSHIHYVHAPPKPTDEEIAREAAGQWFRDFEPEFEPGTKTPTPGASALTDIIHSAIKKAKE